MIVEISRQIRLHGLDLQNVLQYLRNGDLSFLLIHHQYIYLEKYQLCKINKIYFNVES